MATRWLDRSWAWRSSCVSLSRRTNIVGTHWLCVTRKRSIAASAAAASNFSINTTVPPKNCVAIEKVSGAAWYSGAVLR